MTAKKTTKEIAVISITEKEIKDCNVTQIVKVQDGDFVAAVYSDEWFIGQVDQDNEEIEVKFMQKKKQCYQWPIREDIIWVKPQDIICKVEKPVATAKLMRMFKISLDEKDKILNLVTERNLDSN
ncbi:hypothetical protein SNE40_013061 [Patella caerulea]|uniref:Uncharacterized protein n=1 Tax=Patella caerulea TaxID=87958 RepID=A0AAN8JQQ9_PATCE